MTSPEGFRDGPQERLDRPADPPIKTLVADLTDELRALLQLEFALFRIELREKMRRLGRGVIAVAIAGGLAFGALLLLLAAAQLGLARVLQPWLAALVVGIVALGVALLIFYVAKRAFDARKLVPRRTLETLRLNRGGTKDDPR